MSYIKNILAGDNIIIEDLGDDSIRIHNDYSAINLKLDLPSYFDCKYHQAKLDEGDEHYYLHISNCIFQINGNWHEIDDIYFSPSTNAVYDMYLRIQEIPANEAIAENRLDIKVITYHRVTDKVEKPTYPYDHHLFRFMQRSGHVEIIRMQPNLINLTCVKGGFLAYHDYKGVLVRNKNGNNLLDYQGIPTYSEKNGAMLLDTPIEKGGNTYGSRPLMYSGKEYIYLGEPVN